MSAASEEGGPRVVLVVPAYNEESTVRDVAERALATGHPLVLVDDGSTDATLAALEGLPLTLVRHERNLGKAAALWTGIREALRNGADHVVTLDADGQHRPEDLPALVERARRDPGRVVIGARLLERDAAPRGRLFANKVANFFVSWAAGQALADSQSGYRLYPRALFDALGPDFRIPRDFVFESEILILAGRLGFPCAFVPVEAIYPEGRRASHYRPARDTLAIAAMVARRILESGLHPRGFWRAFLRPRRKRLEVLGPKEIAFLALSCLVAVGTLGISFVWIWSRVWRAAREAHPGAPDGALPLVLGVRTLGSGVHENFLARLRHGYRLWARDREGAIAVLGGHTSEHPRSEAEEGADLLESWGVPRERIVLEDRSVHTYENLRNARSHLGEDELARAVVVTNRVHALRCRILARHLEMRVPISVCEADPPRGLPAALGAAKEAFLLHWALTARVLAPRE